MAVAMLAQMPVCTVLPPSAIANEVMAGDLVVHPIVEPSISRRLFLDLFGRARAQPAGARPRQRAQKVPVGQALIGAVLTGDTAGRRAGRRGLQTAVSR